MPSFISTSSLKAKVLKRLQAATRYTLGGLKLGNGLSSNPDGTVNAVLVDRGTQESEDSEFIIQSPAVRPAPNTTGSEVRLEVTGILKGGLLTVTPGTTVFSIADGVGQVVDHYTDQLIPRIKKVFWSGLTNITDLYLTSEVTYISLDSDGNIIQSTSPTVNGSTRTNIIIGFITHTSSVINACIPTPVLAYDNGFLAQDILAALGTVVNGCIYSGGTGLTLKRTSGTLLGRGRHYYIDAVTPNEIPLAATDPVPTITTCRNGSNTVFSSSGTSTTFVVNKYDDGTAAPAGVPNGTVSTNQWQAIRLHLSSKGECVFQYGQTIYNSLSNAIAGVSTETFYQDPLLARTAFRGFMFVRGGATNLSDSGDAVFQAAGKLGEAGSGGGASSSSANLAWVMAFSAAHG